MWQNTKTTHRISSFISLVLLVCVLPEIGVLALIPSPSHAVSNGDHGSSQDSHEAASLAPNAHDTPPQPLHNDGRHMVAHETPQKTKDHHPVVPRQTAHTGPPRKEKKYDTGFSLDPKEEGHEGHHGSDHVEPEELEMEERERKIIFGNHQSFVIHNGQKKNAGVISTLKKPVATVWGELRAKNV